MSNLPKKTEYRDGPRSSLPCSSRVSAALMFLTLLSLGNATNLSEVTQQVIPAYAIACAADMLPASSFCRQDLELFKEGVDRRTLWSLRMLDSSGQPKSGFLYGNNYWLGSRHQCYDTVNPESLALPPETLKNNSLYRNSAEELAPYHLNYFAAYIVHNSTLQYQVVLPGEHLITLGLCLPATCSIKDLSEILENIFYEQILLIGHINKMDLKLLEMRNLSDGEHYSFPWRIIIMFVVIILFTLAIIVATVYDFYQHERDLQVKDRAGAKNGTMVQVPTSYSPRTATKVLLCFSAYTNTKYIFTKLKRKNSIEALNGIRALGMAWMILIHVILFAFEYIDNKIWAHRVAHYFLIQVISNGSVSVDTFFFMSGFLSAYTFLESARKEAPDSREVPWSTFVHRIIRRYIRLTPPYVMTIMLADIIFTSYGQTSEFYILDRPQETCPAYWWRNVLYINNMFSRSEMCLYWSYYLSNDMQFFIIGSFLLFLSQRYFYTSVALFFILLGGHVFIVAAMTYLLDYSPTIDRLLSTMEYLYDPPWIRIGPYLVGLATAYLLIVVMNKKLNVNKITLGLLSILGIICNVSILFGLYERRLSLVTTTIYMALHRTGWAVGIAWLIIVCCTNHGGIVNRILSLEYWQPLSKLAYSAYLLNPLVVSFMHLNSEAAYHFDFIPMIYIFFGVFVLVHVASYFLTVMFEIPFLLLANLYFEGRAGKK